MMDLLWHMRYKFEDWYFYKKYSNKEPKIYYDKRFKCYVHPSNIVERGSFEYVISELIRDGILYKYYIHGKFDHAHSFEGVMESVYYKPEAFEICLEYNQYSQMEIDIIDKIQAFALQERKQDI